MIRAMSREADTPELADYLARHAGQDEVLARVDRETQGMPEAEMQTRPDQAALLTLLVRLTGARAALEVGTFTGYGAICIARGLPRDGHLTILEMSERYARIARRNLDAAGVGDRATIRVGPAAEGLAELGKLDFAYVDADKDGYPAYYDAIVPRLNPGGVLVLDNMLRDGRVVEPQDESARGTAELNARIAADARVDSVLLGLADGMTIVTPKAA
jgi:caffeoyl-CoA O-methyltransferase